MKGCLLAKQGHQLSARPLHPRRLCACRRAPGANAALEKQIFFFENCSFPLKRIISQDILKMFRKYMKGLVFI